MAKTRGMGLLMLWCDVDPEHEEEFNRWYDGEHIERLLSVPGFLSAGRYVALKGGPQCLAMYELEDVSVLRSPAFLDELSYRPSPGRQKTSGGHIGRNYLLNGYRQIFPARATRSSSMGPCRRTSRWAASTCRRARGGVQRLVRLGLRPGLPDRARRPPARRFVAIDGQPKYLTVYDFERADVPQNEACNRVRDLNPWTQRIRPQLKLDAGSPAVFRRIWPA